MKADVANREELLAKADSYWASTVREKFVEEAECWLGKPAIQALYAESLSDERPCLRFRVGLDPDIDEHMGIFLFQMLSERG